jgi:segregation and condensation protein A
MPKSSASYQVTLPVFEGPLDLLLHLIERQELDITQVSLAQVTNQYVDYLAQLSERDPDNLADFLAVAAKLLLIKSRVLLPQPPSTALPEEEGEDLVRQLIEYKKYKEAARRLEELEALGRQSYIRVGAPQVMGGNTDLTGVTLDDLLAAVRQVYAIKPPIASVNGAVSPVSISIADQMALIDQETDQGQSVSFVRMLQRASSRVEIIVTLLALLEMVKQLRVTVRQTGPFGDIVIERRIPSRSPAEA